EGSAGSPSVRLEDSGRGVTSDRDFMDALAFIDAAPKAKPQPVYVLAGDEAFLKRQVRAALDGLLLENADPAFAVASYPGDLAVWSTVRTDLDTLPFLSP